MLQHSEVGDGRDGRDGRDFRSDRHEGQRSGRDEDREMRGPRLDRPNGKGKGRGKGLLGMTLAKLKKKR